MVSPKKVIAEGDAAQEIILYPIDQGIAVQVALVDAVGRRSESLDWQVRGCRASGI